jgi:hypothetical protein
MKKYNLRQGKQLNLETGLHPSDNILKRLEGKINNREIKVVEMISIKLKN